MQYPIKISHENKNYLLSCLPDSIQSLTCQILKQVFKNQEDLGFELHYFDNEGDKIQIETEEDYQTFYRQEVEPQKKGSKIFVTNAQKKELQNFQEDREEDDFWIIKKDDHHDNKPHQQLQDQSKISFEKFPSQPQDTHKEKDNFSNQIEFDLKELQFLQEQKQKEEELRIRNQQEEERLQREQQSLILQKIQEQDQIELSLKLQKENDLSSRKSEELQIPQNRPISPNFEDQLKSELLENKIEEQLKAESFDQKPNPLMVSINIDENEQEQMSVKELVAIEVQNLMPEIVKQVEMSLRRSQQEKVDDRLSFRVNENQQVRMTEQNIPLKMEAEQSIDKPVHHGVTCDICKQFPIVGIRYKCTVNYDYDLCELCEAMNKHPFPLIKIRQPGSYNQKGNFKEVILDVIPFLKENYKRKCEQKRENEEKNGLKKEAYKKCEKEAYKKSQEIPSQADKEQKKAEKEAKKAEKEVKKATKEAIKVVQKEEKKARKAELVTQIKDLFGVEVKNMEALKKIHPDFNVSYIIDYLIRNQIILQEL